ncbi:dephospho-CoA kinase [Shimwellia blattae]|uniref:Dephospho-CoA kinase n=1 Tax=Shimwellia blattae (strain ATCC 29907 / DSM 4481 / JCM 1650 / NBRC 105725 / CDC 9005-74) TaxID=630626 RepID=I2BCR3_SHIBC|nr:dephospho-CoA kinase [Shimwellia blattae]AFJ48317.1 dephospho-CoA kinase [Shimwellia blattae DSM 4481 = NBRC 105725]GAB81011.1 dephospho-CoA kinase [Shimwellia blattae DSM 4481 = NBRC 105725]VDY65812.1 Dephospho-CoA kinase [Shimwellia blattae]VEC25864.1 Dephospho-CoA kinase [Shimwellia blattae]
MCYTVALTGGIGSGKSTVADAFASLGITVVDADIIARQVVAPGEPALEQIAAHFGPTVLQPDGSLDRRALREMIFAHPEKKQWLNNLLHPIIQQKTRDELARARSPYVLWVVPLLVENQLHHRAQRVLVVDVEEETQIQRTMLRDNVSREHASQILAAQATRAARLAVADDVICNDGSPDAVTARVARLHQHYLTLARQAETQEKK